MDVVCKRAFNRNSCETRIKYALYDTGNYINAIMYNNGDGGMYFESDDSVSPGDDLFIKIVDFRTGDHCPEARNGYRAEVMWCRKVFKDGVSVFGVGVRFMVNVCDQCGDKVLYSEINKTNQLIFLCNDCYNCYDSMRSGYMKQKMEDYLLGNVI